MQTRHVANVDRHDPRPPWATKVLLVQMFWTIARAGRTAKALERRPKRNGVQMAKSNVVAFANPAVSLPVAGVKAPWARMTTIVGRPRRRKENPRRCAQQSSKSPAAHRRWESSTNRERT